MDRCHVHAGMLPQTAGGGLYIRENMTSVTGGILSPTFDPRTQSGKADSIMCAPSQKSVSGPTCRTRQAESLGGRD